MIWLSVKEAAELLGYGERAVRKKAQNKEYQNRYISSSAGRGGRKMEILLESLPEQAQKAYHNEHGECQTVFNTDYTYTKSQREKGELRALAVAEHRKYQKEMIKGGMTKKTEIMKFFVTKWNIEHPDFQITSKSLYDWMKKSKTGKVEYLADRRGGYNRGLCSIPKKYQDYFLSLYLQQSKPPFDVCFRLTQIEANKNGDSIPGKKAFRNLLKNMDRTIIIREREGKKAFEDTCMPTTLRDYSQLKPNDMWVSDHHLWDIFVRIPDGKGGWKVARPWGSYWMDMRTRKVMSSFIRVEPPNSDIVLLSFGLAVEKYGIPKKIYMDNGKDYKARDLFYPEGHKSRQDKENQEIVSHGMQETELKKTYNSLAANLQLDVTYANPRNAKAKPIERLFDTFEDGLGKLYASYAGSNAKNRPEDLKDLDIMSMITMEEFIKQHKCYVEDIYNNSSHTGDSMDNKSPDYWYNHIDFTKNTMSSEALYFTLMRTSQPRKVGKEGITFNKELYLNPEYQNYLGREVIIKYNPTKPEIIYVFDINENFLFIATRRNKYGFELTDDDYAKANHEKKLARTAALNGYKQNSEIRSTEAIGQRLNDYANSLDKVSPSTPRVVKPIRNEQIEETIRRVHSSSIDRNYEDVLKANEKIRKDTEEKQKKMVDNFRQKMLDRAKATARQA
ncbi:transposase domain-containing protein [Enterocloster clostridioformis]|nr:transposase domain-containing protein [uncultured Anaerostipes sp.]